MEAQWKSAVDEYDQKTDSVPQQSSHNVSFSPKTLTVGLQSGAVLLSTWPPQTSIVLAFRWCFADNRKCPQSSIHMVVNRQKNAVTPFL